MRKHTILALACLTLIPLAAKSDRGSIPFRPGVEIFEPNQRALIAFNGEEEILLLTTDLMSSEPTKVLEVLPLPSEPEVKKGNIQVFHQATAIINSRAKKLVDAGGKSLGREAQHRPAGEVTFHEKIGAHDISVTRVRDGEGFIKWVEDYLRSNGVETPLIPEPLKEVVREYIQDGFDWFVFDVVSLEKITQTNDAIQYRFKTDFLYYPLRITRTESGYTSVDLLVLTPRLLRDFPGFPIEDVRLMHEPVAVTQQEVASLSKEMDDLMGGREETMLRIWRIDGELSRFYADLVAR